MPLPAVRTSLEVSAVKSTYTLSMTSLIVDAAFGAPTDVVGVPTPVHWY